jgi:hypothetical protein
MYHGTAELQNFNLRGFDGSQGLADVLATLKKVLPGVGPGKLLLEIA